MPNVRYIPTYNEPKPRVYYAIKCFDCNKNVLKSNLEKHHKGHDVHYVDKNGEIDE